MSQALNQAITDDCLSAGDSYARSKAILSQANGFKLDAPRALRLLRKSASLTPEALTFFQLGQLYTGQWRGVNINKALAHESFRRAGRLGCAEMRVKIAGILYQRPLGREEERREALEMIQSDVTNNCAEAMFALAQMLAQEQIAEINSIDAQKIALLRGASHLGHVEALFFLGEALYNESIDGNYSYMDEAMSCYEKAVESGHARAACKLGKMCSEGMLKYRPDRAVFYYRLAAQKGCVDAMHTLGNILYHGDFGVEKNEIEGITWLERAAAAGGGFYKYWLALTITQRNGGPARDLDRVMRLFREAISDGNLLAHVELGCILLYGSYGSKSDKDEGISLLEHAIECGEEKGMQALGQFFISGETNNDEAHISQGVHLLKNAIDLGESRAAYDLGKFLLDGAPPSFPPDINRALQLMELAASRGMVAAMYDLGLLYVRGDNRGVDLNVEKGISYHRQAISKGNVESMISLARILMRGTSEVEQDSTTAINLLSRASDAEHCLATRLLAGIYLYGQFVERDVPRAVQLYKKAVEFGSEDAVMPLATLLYNGEDGIERDVPTTVNLYERAAQTGNSTAEYLLAGIYERGEPDSGIEKNLDRAIGLYRSASEKGDTDAQTRLGTILYYSASDSEGDIENEAADVLEAAADTGCTAAMYELAILWEFKMNDPRHMEHAIHLYKKAAEHGNVNAMLYIAEMYLTGNYVEKDSRLFVKYLEEGIELDSPEAMTRLAKFFRQGDSLMPRNMSKAVHLLQTAISLGHAPARDMLADIFFHGEGEIKRDVLEALRLYRAGVDEKHGGSMFELGKLFLQGVDGYLVKNVQEALELFRQAGQYGHSEAFRIAGNMLVEGTGGIERDIKAAVKLYLKAIEEHDVEAMLALGIIYEMGSNELPQDLSRAIHWYKEAIMCGHTEALVRFCSLALAP